MGLSVGSLSTSYGNSFVQPLNYGLKNKSEISDAFEETGMQNAITNVPPVQYPNARELQSPSGNNNSDSTASVVRSQEANKMYNKIAEKFGSMTVGYAGDSSALTYGTVGGNLDLFA
ncbi:MAG: hypothetical protein J5802_14510 [Butyrivibrio sp.]|nr:hypothetical protein [Butyrivibrio sp.]